MSRTLSTQDAKLFLEQFPDIDEKKFIKLEKLADYLLKNLGFDVLIEGHCDGRGSDEYNRALGERRAIAVQFYLSELGIPENRIHTLSLGEEMAKNESDDNHHEYRKAVSKLILRESQGSNTTKNLP